MVDGPQGGLHCRWFCCLVGCLVGLLPAMKVMLSSIFDDSWDGKASLQELLLGSFKMFQRHCIFNMFQPCLGMLFFAMMTTNRIMVASCCNILMLRTPDTFYHRVWSICVGDEYHHSPVAGTTPLMQIILWARHYTLLHIAMPCPQNGGTPHRRNVGLETRGTMAMDGAEHMPPPNVSDWRPWAKRLLMINHFHQYYIITIDIYWQLSVTIGQHQPLALSMSIQ